VKSLKCLSEALMPGLGDTVSQKKQALPVNNKD
jgi:hypothetical protein